MAGLANYDDDGTLTIGGVSMNCPAWMVGADEDGEGGLLDFITNVETRGENRILPGANGVIPYPRRPTETEHDIRLVVIGEVDRLGVAQADHTAGLVANLQYLMTNVVTPPAAPTATRAATYTPPGTGSASITADLQVVGLRRESYALGTNALWIGRMIVKIPEAAFA